MQINVNQLSKNDLVMVFTGFSLLTISPFQRNFKCFFQALKNITQKIIACQT